MGQCIVQVRVDHSLQQSQYRVVVTRNLLPQDPMAHGKLCFRTELPGRLRSQLLVIRPKRFRSAQMLSGSTQAALFHYSSRPKL